MRPVFHLRAPAALSCTVLTLSFALAFPVAAQTPPGAMDCTHVNAAGPAGVFPQGLRSYCAAQPTQDYTRAHEAELVARQRRIEQLRTNLAGAHPAQREDIARQISAEQQHVDTLNNARAAHMAHVQASDQLHRARFGRPPTALPQRHVPLPRPTAAPPLPTPGATVHPPMMGHPAAPGTVPHGG